MGILDQMEWFRSINKPYESLSQIGGVLGSIGAMGNIGSRMSFAESLTLSQVATSAFTKCGLVGQLADVSVRPLFSNDISGFYAGLTEMTKSGALASCVPTFEGLSSIATQWADRNNNLFGSLYSSVQAVQVPTLAGALSGVNEAVLSNMNTFSTISDMVSNIGSVLDVYKDSISKFDWNDIEIGNDGSIAYSGEVYQQEDYEPIWYDIADAITQKNWQQAISEPIKKWAEKNPVLAYIINAIIIAIMVNLLSDCISPYIVKNETALVEAPQQRAQQIIVIEKEQTVIPVDSQPYWVKVTYTDETTGEVFEGWIAKRNLEVCDNQEEVVNE